MANGQTSQAVLRLDDDTKLMLEHLAEHYTALFGSADLSFAARACIRQQHKHVFPDRWHGEYFKPEASTKLV